VNGKKHKTTGQHVGAGRLCTCALVACALILAGCQQTQRADLPNQICVADADKLQVMQAAESVLAQMHFRIAKFDPNTGYIQTRPLPAGQFFEFWRSDNVGPANAAEANLHSLRRTAELRIAPQAQRLCIDCEVNVQRLSMPPRDTTSTPRAYQMFSKSTSSLQKLRLSPEQQERMAWIDLGNDSRLSAKILKRIEQRLTRTE
jgi:hypothetical protein